MNLKELNEIERFAYQNTKTPLEMRLYECLKKYIDLVEVLDKHDIPPDPDHLDEEIVEMKKFVGVKDNLIDDIEDVLRGIELPLDTADKIYTVLERYY